MKNQKELKHYTPAAVLARAKLFLDFQRAFTAGSGLTILIREPDSAALVQWPVVSANSFCSRLANSPFASAPYKEVQHKLADAAHHLAQTQQCFAGLDETMVPVRSGNRILALLQFGQVRSRQSTEEATTRVVEDAAVASHSIEADRLAHELRATRKIHPERYAAFVHLAELFSLQLADWFVRYCGAETPRPASITMRTREWLDAHYHEPIELDDAAKAVGVTRWHLSRVIHRHTGLVFRELVAHVRLERACHWLAHHDMPIHKIATTVGFQSKSQFNRIFRRVHKQSPSEYRQAMLASRVRSLDFHADVPPTAPTICPQRRVCVI